MKFIQAAGYTRASRGRGDIDFIVIHDMEMTERVDTAEDCARYFAGQNPAKSSAHRTCDANSVVQCVRDHDIAWHAPPNSRSLGIEHAGFARQTRDQWLDAYGRKMLAEQSAPSVAAWCEEYGLPKRYIDWRDLRAGKKGITTHNDVTLAWGQTSHTDPGPHFPMRWYIGQVNGVDVSVDWTGDPALSSGDSGDYVSDLQRMLVAHGYDLAVDGDFGPNTEDAVRAFQRDAGLTVDGVAGPATYTALEEADVALSDADKKWILDHVGPEATWHWDGIPVGTTPDNPTWTAANTLANIEKDGDNHGAMLRQLLAAIKDLPGVTVDVDEQALAQAVLTGLSPEAIAAAIADSLPEYELVKKGA